MECTWWELWWVPGVFWASKQTDKGINIRLPNGKCGNHCKDSSVHKTSLGASFQRANKALELSQTLE